VVALTILAAGTSLPEVATSLVAAVRGQRDLAVGNVVGSNIFNVLGILGLAGLVAPRGLETSPALLAFDLPVMVAVGVACLPIFFTGHEIRRWEGILLLIGYLLYVTYLILDSTGHDALSGFTTIALLFALPLALLGVAGSVVNAIFKRRKTDRPAPR
jgi:cation:H+ antiporter